MNAHHELVVIGAGPAGMASAALVAEQGASVLLLDEQPRPGGQVYRGVDTQAAADRSILGEDYYRGSELTDRLRASSVEYAPCATVWHVSPDLEIGVTMQDRAHLLTADQIIIANGAQERPFPVQGWTLPGVMTVGAAQILLKASGVILPNVVFVGTGPLLYLTAQQYLRAGAKVEAILDTTPRSNIWRALPALPSAMAQAGSLFKGLRWLWEIRASGTRFVKGVEDFRIDGTDEVVAIEFLAAGQWDRIEASTALLHQGVAPNANLAMAAGCKHAWSESQSCWHAQTDDWGLSTVDGIAIAGDGAGISGAHVAEDTGRLAALGALCRLGRLDATRRDMHAVPLRKSLSRQTGLRKFLDALYRPAPQFRIPQNAATIVCRCEEVTAGNVKDAVDQGCRSLNHLKSFTRAGMGPCQGRFCGLTISEMMADKLSCPVQEVGAARTRLPVKPLEIGQLAALVDGE